MLELKATPNKKYRWTFMLPGQRGRCRFRFLREETRRDIKIFFPLFIDKVLHLTRVWLGITASKLTTTCAWHWSKGKWYILQEFLSNIRVHGGPKMSTLTSRLGGRLQRDYFHSPRVGLMIITKWTQNPQLDLVYSNFFFVCNIWFIITLPFK